VSNLVPPTPAGRVSWWDLKLNVESRELRAISILEKLCLNKLYRRRNDEDSIKRYLSADILESLMSEESETG
jgi:hypothetical protein